MNGNSRHGSRQASAEAERIAALLEPTVSAMGMDLEDVRITSAGRRRLLRVVVDADGGVSLDDIALVSHKLSASLDAAAAMGEAPYTLEVSSPGVDRPLTEPKHWRRAVGRLVTAPLTSQPPSLTDGPADSPTVSGRVRRAGEHGVLIDVSGGSREFGYAELGPGRVQIEFAPLGEGARRGADEEEPDGH
jgi:ribosome maturation factor RimP